MSADKDTEQIGTWSEGSSQDAAKQLIDDLEVMWNNARLTLTTSEKINLRDVRAALALQEAHDKEVEAQVRRIAEAIDARQKEHSTFMTATKRGVMQILKGIGWLD